MTNKDKKHQTSNHDISVTAEAGVTEIINLRHLEWFQLASDVSNQRAQYYANIQKFSRNYVERCLRKCIFCPNGQIVEVCNGQQCQSDQNLSPSFEA